MYLGYVDDARNTGQNITDGKQPYHFVGATLLYHENWRALRNDVRTLQNGLPHGIRADPAFEFRGAYLFNGTGLWKRLTREDRQNVYASCIDLLATHDVTVVYGCCNKKLLRGYTTPMHPHEIAFWLCLEGVAEHVNAAATTTPRVCTQIVADESDRDSALTRRVLNRYRRHDPPFGRAVDVSRIIDIVHFMNSRESPHLQLCDLCTYALRRFYVANDRMGGICDRVRNSLSRGRWFPYNR